MKIHFLVLCIFALTSSCNKSIQKTELIPTNSPPETITPKNFPIKVFKTMALSPINISYSPFLLPQELMNQYSLLDSEKKLKFESFLKTTEKQEQNKTFLHSQSSWTKDKKQGFDLVHIVEWIEKNSCGKSQDTITTLDQKTSTIAISTICIKNVWQKPFSTKNTKLAHFQSSPHASYTVKFMETINHYRYFESEQSKWVELEFENSPLVRVLGIPKTRFEIKKTESELNPEFISSLNSKLKEERVSLAIPKFSLIQNTNLRDPLSQSGMDFIFNKNNYKKNQKKFKSLPEEIIQIANLKIDEHGLNLDESNFPEAKKSSTIRILSKQFYADQPFVVLIQNRKTDDLLILGRVYQP